MPDFVKKARKLERRGEYLRAAEYYVLGGFHERAIELFVQQNLFLKAAKICERIGKSDKAAEYYSQIGDYKHAAELLKQAGDTFQAALMFKRGKQFREAADMFERSGIIAEAARMLEAEKDYQGAASRYMKAEMVRSAAVCYEKAAEIEEPLALPSDNPQSAESNYYQLLQKAAEAWLSVPDISKTAHILEKLQNWNQAGKYYEQCGEAEKAIECYRKCGELESAINLLKRLGQHQRAAKLSAKKSEQSGDHLTAAHLAEQQGDLSTAAANYEKAGKYIEAAELYEGLMDYMLAAEMYFRADNFEKAAKMYEFAGNDETAASLYDEIGIVDKAIQLHVRTKNFHRAAELHLNRNENEEALRLLLRKTEDHPSSDSVLKLLGICYFRLGKVDTGLGYTKDIISQPVADDNIEVHYEYACALYESGNTDKALEYFEQIVELDRNFKDARNYLNVLAAMQEKMTAAQSDTIVGELPIGLIVNKRYELLELLGKGAMGVVYRAADRELNLAVALKILRPKFSYDPDFIEMIKREVTLARMLAHPNIIKIYDLNRAGHLWFVSMEFLRGHELKDQILTHSALPIPRAIKIARQILAGLEHSHEKKLVHSDIKPQNIFIDSSDNVTIVDFGIARAAGSVSEDGMVQGTPEYISPEQIHGDPATVKSDLYSFGVTLYEMLTGEMAFKGPDLESVLNMQLDLIPPCPSDLRSEIPEWLSDIVMKLMEKDPIDRYETATDVINEIRNQT